MRSRRPSVSIASPFTLGHSPDPDDAFMFYAMAKNKIDLRGYRFEHRLEDIQTLNERARRGELYISAVSIHAYACVSDKYALLPCGASMGDGYGPVVVRKRPVRHSHGEGGPTRNPAKEDTRQAAQRPTPNLEQRTSNAGFSAREARFGVRRSATGRIRRSELDAAFERSTPNAQRPTSNWDAARDSLAVKKIAVPGKMTSAFLALQLFLGEFEFTVVPFDKIFEAVENGTADAGLIIHEGQLTYARSGFEKIIDLGEWWKDETGLPLPLGGNVVRKDIPPAVRRDLSAIIRESIDYGLTHRDEAVAYSLAYARDMNAQLASKFIGMYVNEFTRDYGEIGRAAIRKFLAEAHDKGYIDTPIELEFVE